MADGTNLMTCVIDELNEETAPNGAGFYYTTDEEAGIWTGPFITQAVAEEAVMELLQDAANTFVRQSLGL